MSGNTYIYIFVMAAVSYLLRVVPMTVMRKPIKNRFVKSFLYYIPYVTLTIMTFPAIITATGSYVSGVAALVIGVLLAYFTKNLFIVACGCCASVLILSFIIV